MAAVAAVVAVAAVEAVAVEAVAAVAAVAVAAVAAVRTFQSIWLSHMIVILHACPKRVPCSKSRTEEEARDVGEEKGGGLVLFKDK